MTSFTSSSSAPDQVRFNAHLRAPALRPWRLVALMLATAIALVAAWEGLLAARGVQPADTPGDMQHWLIEYDRVQQGQADVVFIGSSRVQIGVSPDEVERTLAVKAGRVANLGVPFSSSLPLLRELAANQRFKGTVVAEVLPVHFFGNAQSNLNVYLEQTARPRPYLRAELNAHEMWRARARSAAGHGPAQELRGVLAGDGKAGGTPQLTSRLHPDRWYEVTVSDLPEADRQALAEAEADQFRWPGRRPTESQWRAMLEEVRGLVEVIERRGGRVLFVRMPSDRRVREVEDARFPDAEFWQPFAANLPGRCVHFADDPVLSRIGTYDGSHIGSAEAKLCSRRLAEILAARGR